VAKESVKRAFSLLELELELLLVIPRLLELVRTCVLLLELVELLELVLICVLLELVLICVLLLELVERI
jgi:hypothetical protein